MTSAAETGLVLSGGGAYGAFAVGIMKVLFAGRSPVTSYQPLDAEIFTGTSVGAFNVGLLAGSTSNLLDAVLHLERIWTERIAVRSNSCRSGIFRVRGDVTDFFDPNCLPVTPAAVGQLADDAFVLSRYALTRTANFLASSSSIRSRLVGLVNLESFIDWRPFDELLNDVLDSEAVFNSSRRVRIIATDWITGQVISFDNSHFGDDTGRRTILASAAIPGIFPPVRIGPHLCVDGGVVQNTPLKPAIEMGATHLHVIYLDPHPDKIPLKLEANSVDTMLRVYHLMLATKIEEDVETARWINAGLAVLNLIEKTGEAPPGAGKTLTRIIGKLTEDDKPYKELTIHRYFPNVALGPSLGMFDFDRDQVLRMIEEGERAALVHDCYENKCVFRQP